MPGFEEMNPFGDPLADSFSDPTVQQAINKNPQNIQQGLDDYNPFADPTNQKPSTVRGASNPPPQYAPGGPAIMSPTQDVQRPTTLPYGPAGSQPPLLTTSELQRRQEELDRKAAELERREQELRRNETNIRRNNWPPLPENFCWQPCFYIDISVEIPPEFQRVVTHLYYSWILHTGLLFANILGALLLLFVKGDLGRFFLAVVYGALLTPASFMCWFRPGYKAFRNDSSFNFMVFFFIYFFQFLISVDQSIGLGSSGFCGILVAYDLLRGNAADIVLGLFVGCIAVGFCISAVLDFYLISLVHKIYRSSGASFQKAQQEFASGFLSNEHVRGAAANVAQAAVRQQFSQQYSGQQQQQMPSNRY